MCSATSRSILDGDVVIEAGDVIDAIVAAIGDIARFVADRSRLLLLLPVALVFAATTAVSPAAEAADVATASAATMAAAAAIVAVDRATACCSMLFDGGLWLRSWSATRD